MHSLRVRQFFTFLGNSPSASVTRTFAQRLCFSPYLAILLTSASAFAQTAIDITSQAPSTAICSYPTGSIHTGSTPGHLATQLTGTPSGAGCAAAGSQVSPGTFGPASPLAPNNVSLAGGTAIATIFTVQPLNVVSCTASIATTVGSGTGTLTNGGSVCNSKAACASGAPFSIPATFTNTSTTVTSKYDLKVTCDSASGANPTTTVSSVTVNQAAFSGDPPPPGSCATIPSSTAGIANFTQLTGVQDVDYFVNGHFNVDVTSFDALYHAPWPGNSADTAVVTLPTNKFVAAKFHVPTGYMAGYSGAGLYGDYSVNQSKFSTSVSMSISTSCGDFANPATNPTSTVVPGCWKNKAVTNGYVQWRKDTTCTLHDNTDYYLNYINADVSGVHAISGNTAGGTASSTKNENCSGACTNPIANNPGSWTSYTFP